MHDITDDGLWRIIVRGSIVGMIGMFIVTFGIGMIAGVGPGPAAAIAVIPTIFGGWFYGGTTYLLKAAYGHVEQKRPPTPAAVRSEETVPKAA